MLENIYDTYSPIVENLEGSNGLFNGAETTLVMLQGAMRVVGLTGRRLGKARKGKESEFFLSLLFKIHLIY